MAELFIKNAGFDQKTLNPIIWIKMAAWKFTWKAHMAKFDTKVLFDSVVRANLSYGGLVGLEGLTQGALPLAAC